MQSTILFPVCLIIILLQLFNNSAATLTTEDLRTILTAIPEDEIDDFLTTNIQLGYRVAILGEEINPVEEAELAADIFDYFLTSQDSIKSKKQQLLEHVSSYVATVICFPDPIGCIDDDDSGVRPVI